MIRIGYSRDIHRLEDNSRPLIIGGIQIPFNKGPVSHSDGDVVFHSLGEALLGALAKGDLGTYFPDNDIKSLNLDSRIILEKCYSFVLEAGYSIVNIDINVILEKPKLKDYILKMRENIADILKISLDQVSIKAQTNEQCGEIGQGKALEAVTVLLIEK